MEGTEITERQHQQLARYLQWVEKEGGIEGPTHLDTWFKPHQQYRLRWLKRHCAGTVMELGTCYGYVLAFCGGQIGVDWNEKNIALARILNPSKEFVVADIRKLPFPDGYVDTVMACDVLEHIPWEDTTEAIKEAKRVARRKVLITLPDGDKDLPDAICFKHKWLATRREVQAICNYIPATVERKHGFIFIEVIK